ncbi:DUF4240 domain-containing protein [Luteimonas aquatica]|uniref:DUF4240 domain-containing protein n=1 Tax=Luteimonas aquatica TaxID=450364 RepID=UPI001F5952AD|nr:hypothetical protein [Luteimonas aquatica]
MALRGTDAYDWHVYTAKAVHPLESAKRQQGSLIKGGLFGLRRAGSKKGVYRLILKELGPTAVFSLTEEEARLLLKRSTPLAEGPPAADARTRALASRLERTDPKDFWAVVHALNWPRHHKDPAYAEQARATLRECYGLQNVRRLWRMAIGHRRRLQAAVLKAEKQAKRQLFLGGDDSFYDAVAHAVSTGRESYDRYLQRPETFVRTFNRMRIESHNFEACFD